MFESKSQTPAVPIPPTPPKPGGVVPPSVPPKPAPPAALSVPAGANKSKEPETVIRVMPAEYYGVSPKTPVKKTSAPIVPPPPVKVPPPPKPPVAAPVSGTGTKKRKIPVVLIVGLLLLIVIGVGGFLLLRSLKPSSPPVVVTNTTPPPTNTTPAVQCGNLVCEAGETSSSCSVDCVPTPPPPPPAIRGGIDTDSDGLTDVEETTLYKSDPKSPDTDGDSFIDGNEVFNLYDPTKPSPALLVSDGAVELGRTIIRHYNPELKEYTVAAPVTITWWDKTIADGIAWENGGSINNKDTLSIRFLERSFDSNIDVFLASLAPKSSFIPFHSKGGFEGKQSEDRRTIVLVTPKYYVVFEYTLDPTSRTVEFLRTFEMMANSFAKR